MTKQTQILSGNFAAGSDAKGKPKAGNFSGYNAKGERIFVHKAAMEALGFKSDADLKGKFPLFAIVGERDINTRDENGEVTTVTTKRLQALSVFTKREDMTNAVNADKLFEIQAAAALANEVKVSGLTPEQFKALAEAAI